MKSESKQDIDVSEAIPKVSTLKSALNMINFTFLGSAVLSCPYAFLIGGWVPSVSILILFALASYYSSVVIYKTIINHNLNSYTGISLL